MLLGAGRHRAELMSARDSVHNHYEHLVIEQILRSNDRASWDSEFLADVTCVALNRLPPRYIRHDVDMTFFLSPQELDEMDDKVAAAVNDAVAYVLSRESITEPSEGVEEPSATNKEPSAINKELSARNEEPSEINKEPSATNKEPSAINKEPSATNEDPSASNKDSSMSNKEPSITDKKQPPESAEQAKAAE